MAFSNDFLCETDKELTVKQLHMQEVNRNRMIELGMTPLTGEALDEARNTPCMHCGVRAFDCQCAGGLG